MRIRLQTTVLLILLGLANASSSVLYVNVTNTNPVPPYSNWMTAALSIQDAVDASADGDLILVTNGVYATGGRVIYGALTNRVAVTKGVTVQSVNGPAVTTIQGYQMPGSVWGDSAVRCVYLTNNAALLGFTLFQGATRSAGDTSTEQSGGAVWCESTNTDLLSNCVVAANSAADVGGAVFQCILMNCLVASNSAGNGGGGAYACGLTNCTLAGNYTINFGGLGGGASVCVLSNCCLSNNVALGGGGAVSSTLFNCLLSSNTATSWGGGAEGSTLIGCLLTNNAGGYTSGGADGGTLSNCTLVGNNSGTGGGGAVGFYAVADNCVVTSNSTAGSGGGAEINCLLNNCVLIGNVAGGYGGGADSSTLNNCTLIGNVAASQGGGASGSTTLNNCIVYFNTASAPSNANYEAGCVLNYCCTTPMPTNGTGIITTDPQMADFEHLSAASPCRGAGSTNYSTGVDIDGEAWLNPPSMGCAEYHAGSITGLLSAAIVADYTNVVTGFTAHFTELAAGQANGSLWTFGDGSVVSNEVYVTHSWSTAGSYPVTLTLYNDSYPSGVSATVTVAVASQLVCHVDAAGTNPVPPYSSWSTAATNLQDAVDAALPVPGFLVLVTNGNYQFGGRSLDGLTTNRLTVRKPILVQSVNGWTAVTIDGGGRARCVYLTNGAVLQGFLLTNGYANGNGGGVLCASTNESVFNCVMVDNAATASGGGACLGTLEGCALTGNTAGANGGAAEQSLLNNCTLTGNSAALVGGGADSSTLANCVVEFNIAPNQLNYSSSSFNYCCTTPVPGAGTNNISADPLMTDSLHLSAGSPCLGTGNPAAAFGVDIDSEAWSNPPAIGCDQYTSTPITGALVVSAQAFYTNVAAGFSVNLAGTVLGHAQNCVWDFGDGTFTTNELYPQHAWATSGDYAPTLTAYNGSNPSGVSAATVVHVFNQPVHYVSQESPSPAPPYLSWSTAATNIQDAVDAAYGGATVLVSNGVYCTGGRPVYGVTNRVAINKAIVVQSLSGPAGTLIEGANGNGSVRCVYLTNNATLSGFTLTNGATASSGGGVWCESTNAILTNCVLINCSAGASGGGAYLGTLNNCTLTQNTAIIASGASGGGASGSLLNNCVLKNNYAQGLGGGANSCTLIDCALFGNYAGLHGGGASWSVLSRCTLSGNSAVQVGGGCLGGTATACLFTTNSAEYGGGADYSTRTIAT